MSALHDRLTAAITSWNLPLDAPLTRLTPLISSGRLDSLGLFRLLTWVEDALGHPVDATTIDMAVEWDTIDAVVAFVEREAG